MKERGLQVIVCKFFDLELEVMAQIAGGPLWLDLYKHAWGPDLQRLMVLGQSSVVCHDMVNHCIFNSRCFSICVLTNAMHT